MKQRYVAAAIAVGLVSPLSQADTLLGVYAGVDGWKTETTGSFSSTGPLETFNFEDENFTSFYVALEHPVPLIPNMKFKHNEIDISGTTTLDSGFSFGGSDFQVNTPATTIGDFSHNDLILYYEIFDNDLFSIDLGFNVKDIDGNISVKGQTLDLVEVSETQSFSGYVPLGYAAAEAGLPFTGFSVFFEGSLLAIDDSKIQDYQVGVAWEFVDNMAVDIAVKFGYRSLLLELDDVDDVTTDLEIQGPFAGLQVHF